MRFRVMAINLRNCFINSHFNKLGDLSDGGVLSSDSKILFFCQYPNHSIEYLSSFSSIKRHWLWQIFQHCLSMHLKNMWIPLRNRRWCRCSICTYENELTSACLMLGEAPSHCRPIYFLIDSTSDHFKITGATRNLISCEVQTLHKAPTVWTEMISWILNMGKYSKVKAHICFSLRSYSSLPLSRQLHFRKHFLYHLISLFKGLLEFL